MQQYEGTLLYQARLIKIVGVITLIFIYMVSIYKIFIPNTNID